MAPRRAICVLLALAVCVLLWCFAAAVTTDVPVPAHAHVKPKPVPMTASAADAVHAEGSLACILGHTSPMAESDSTLERFFVYAPPPGVAQPVALRHAIAWSSLLNRTLVLPHLLGRSSSSGAGRQRAMASFGSAFDLTSAHSRIAPLRVIEMEQFAKMQALPERLLVLQQPGVVPPAPPSSFEYFEALRMRQSAARADGGSSESGAADGAPTGDDSAASDGGDGDDGGDMKPFRPFRVELPAYSEGVVAAAFGGCVAHRVSARRSHH